MTDLTDLRTVVMENGKILTQHLVECGQSNGRMEAQFANLIGKVAQLQAVIISAAAALIVALVSLIGMMIQRGAHL